MAAMFWPSKNKKPGPCGVQGKGLMEGGEMPPARRKSGVWVRPVAGQ